MKAHALAGACGISSDEARAAARRRIGNPLRLREQSREPWTFPTVETFAQDVRHALRLMRRDPAFTFTVLVTLALGIGLNRPISDGRVIRLAARRVGNPRRDAFARPVMRVVQMHDQRAQR